MRWHQARGVAMSCWRCAPAHQLISQHIALHSVAEQLNNAFHPECKGSLGTLRVHQQRMVLLSGLLPLSKWYDYADKRQSMTRTLVICILGADETGTQGDEEFKVRRC
jgi:hypothetical protein